MRDPSLQIHSVAMNPNHPQYPERERISKCLDRRISDLFLKRLKTGWDIPALKALADSDNISAPLVFKIRLFDMKGDGEETNLPADILQLLEDFHAVCCKMDERWKQLVITMNIASDRKSFRLQWDYSYP